MINFLQVNLNGNWDAQQLLDQTVRQRDIDILRSDTAEHTLFHCPNWDGLRGDLRNRLGRTPSVADAPDILCGPLFEDLPANHQERDLALREDEETFRIFYKMVVDILKLKEEEERVRQAAEVND
ncbi:uncharacterized protein LOC112592835 [Melanaphis sacchari]|uniref:uncharacterized protein LOC112592835 n=1 Tax=Melanaphis sacchari TaxID=742174 RepID=UPI000DC15394|nr:uncharacterized protein LOC112592835 [Melanaphis sacchari]